MSVKLQKGQKINLSKEAAGLQKVMVGLGCDEAPFATGFFASLFGSKPMDIDCDASVILCGKDGKVLSRDAKKTCIYFGNLKDPSGAIEHQGDNLTGAGDGDDEQIKINLQQVPGNVERMVFVVNIYDANKRGQHFGMIKNAFIRLVDLKNNTEICKFDLTENYDGMTGLIVGELYRKEGQWKFNAIGQPVREASRLDSLLNMFT